MATLLVMSRRPRAALVTVLIVLLTVVLIRCSFPGETIERGDGIVGTYVVNGVDANGVEYSGTVRIDRLDRDGGRHRVQWIVTGAIQEGEGVLTGDRFEVVWRTVSSGGPGSSGTATYELGSDGVLRGTRTIDGTDGVGTEEIFPDT